MNNIPVINPGIVAVSRDCFPADLAAKRRSRVVEECKKKRIPISEVQKVIENENDLQIAFQEINSLKINALVVFLGNFGPEGPAAMLAQKFNGPVMFAAAAEEKSSDLYDGRGDAYCGLLSASYNLGLRNLRVHMSDKPVGTADEISGMISEFIPIARAILGIRNLKIFSFGPRPFDFFTCHAPIKPLFDLGVEVMENSELDMYDIFLSKKGDQQIKSVAADMAKELGKGNKYPDLLEPLAQFELSLLDYLEKNLGASKYAVFANKCWPSFEKYFGFVPCYVNSRLAARGIPIACEADIYGALSEYICTCVSNKPAAILDINNTVPDDMYKKEKKHIHNYKQNDLFLGFHCGNTSSSCMASCSMNYQIIMHRLLEPGKPPDITRGTLEGQIRPGDITLFRLQSTADAKLMAFAAEGEILNINPKSFGCIAVFAVKEMARFYRYALLEKQFPHHTAVSFTHNGQGLWDTMKLLGITDLSANLPKGTFYPTEYPIS